MLKVVALFFTLVLIVHAQYDENRCISDIKKMTYTYRLAEEFYNKKNYKKSIEKFQSSYKNSHLALKSCAEKPDYDFNLMYNYIIESENRIYQIREELLN